MHSSAVALYRAMMDVEPSADDPDIQAAIKGLNAAVIHTPEGLKKRARTPTSTAMS